MRCDDHDGVANFDIALLSGGCTVGQGDGDGLQSKASANSAVAIGSRATVSHTDSVALGAGSETAEAVGTNSATVNGVSYSGFAGTNPRSTVSVGYAGGERTITNVAAGRISATSTDAVDRKSVV